MEKKKYDDVESIYKKRNAGKLLTADEQKTLQDWLADQKISDDELFDKELWAEVKWAEQQAVSWEVYKAKYNIQVPPSPTGKQEATVQVIRTRSRWVYPAVAASLLIVLAGLLWWRNDGKMDQKTVNSAKNTLRNLVPGHSKVTLYLNDDSAIALDVLKTGMLVKQGSTSLYIPSPGHLQYQANSMPASSELGPSWSTWQPLIGQESKMTNTLKTSRGGEFQLMLPDGTTVRMSPASAFRYPVAFSDTDRVVELLEGEAYFEVAKTRQPKPFIVQVKGKRVEVLGTHFNISAYEKEMESVTLVEGAVRASIGQQQQLLKPGQQAVMSGIGIDVKPADNLDYIQGWKSKVFSFHNTRLSVIMAALGRWYDVEVIYKVPIKDESFVIDDYPRSVPVTEILGHLEASSSFRFKVADGKIYVSY